MGKQSVSLRPTHLQVVAEKRENAAQDATNHLEFLMRLREQAMKTRRTIMIVKWVVLLVGVVPCMAGQDVPALKDVFCSLAFFSAEGGFGDEKSVVSR
jgi:hypothetical protein